MSNKAQADLRNKARAELHYPDPKNGPWIVLLWFVTIDGRLEPTGFVIQHREEWPSEKLTAAFMQKINFGTLESEGRQQIFERILSLTEPEHAEELRAEGFTAEFVSQVQETFKRRLVSASIPRRPKDLTDDDVREIARVYRNAFLVEGKPPTKAVAEHFDVTRNVAAKYVQRARKEGHLPPTKPREARA